jgi:hypothetical protein
VEFHGIPRNFMKLRLMEFRGNQWNSMKFREFTEFDGIRFRQGSGNPALTHDKPDFYILGCFLIVHVSEDFFII